MRFFTVETLFLQTLYVLVFIEIGTRRVHFAGCTAHPDNAWVTQQARQVMWEFEDRNPDIRFLIRDNDKKFTESVDTVFRAEGIDVIRTPYHAPNANAYAERWIRSAREECLDKLLIINQASSTPRDARIHNVLQHGTPTSGPCTPDSSPKNELSDHRASALSYCVGGYHQRLLP
jgi:putative transposase